MNPAQMWADAIKDLLNEARHSGLKINAHYDDQGVVLDISDGTHQEEVRV